MAYANGNGICLILVEEDYILGKTTGYTSYQEQQKIMVLGFTEQQVQVEQAGTRNGRVIDFGVSATFDETSAFVDGLVPYGDIP